MKNNRFIGRMLSALLIAIMLITMMPLAFASRCPENPDGAHYWGEWDTDRKATCSRAGQKSRACKYCRKVDTKSIPKKSHSYGSWKTTKEATCTRKGERTRKCTVCGHKDTDTIKMKAHSWGEWTVITEPTEFTTGISEHTCKVCGKTAKQDIYPEGTLKKGDKGDRVKELQTSLNENGYDCGKADGDFGKKTEKAVKSLETAIGVEPDGIAWPGVVKTLAADEEVVSEGVCTFEKWEESVPGNGHGYYEEGETVTYGFMIRNDHSAEDDMPIMLQVEIFDPILNSESRVAYFEGIFPGAEDGCSIDYTVTAEDVARGYIENTATVRWHESDPKANTLGESRSSVSNTVTVNTAPEEEPESALVIELLSFSCPNGEEADDCAEGKLRITNNGETKIFVSNFYSRNKDGVIMGDDHFVSPTNHSELEPGESMVFDYYTYIREDPDVIDGWIARDITVFGTEIGGGAEDAIESNTVHAGLELSGTTETVSNVHLEKWISSYPANGEYFVEGETINYTLELVNDSNEPITDIEINDPMKGSNEDACVDRVESIAAGSSHRCSFDHVVTAQDAADCVIYNQAYASWAPDGEVYSDEIRADTGSESGRYYAKFEDCVFVGGTYNEYFTISDVATGSVCQNPTLIYGDIDKLGLEYDWHTDSSVDVWYRGTVTQPGIGKARYTMLVDDDLWTIDIVLTSLEDGDAEMTEDLHIDLLSFEVAETMTVGSPVHGEIKVTNIGDDILKVYNGWITTTENDFLYGEQFGTYPANAFALAPNDSFNLTFTAIIQEEDYTAGVIEREITMLSELADGSDDELILSNTVIASLDIGDEPTPDEAEYSLHIDLNYFNPETVMAPGTELTGEITVTNTGDGELNLIGGRITYTDGTPDPGAYFDAFPSGTDKFASGESFKLGFHAVVSAYDVSDVTRDICVDAVIIGGEDDGKLLESNTVRASIVPENDIVVDTPTENTRTLVVTKEEISVPAKGYYEKDDIITYRIKMKNNTGLEICDVYVYDCLATGPVGYLKSLGAGEENFCTFFYPVTEADISEPYLVINYADVVYNLCGIIETAYSNEVRSKVGESTDPDIPDTPDTPIPPVIDTPVLEGDCCERRIVERGEEDAAYTLHYCAEHFATQEAVAKMVEVAVTPDLELTAWQTARDLWQSDADAMYDSLMKAANGPAKVIVLNERILFNGQIATHEAALNALYPDEPARVAKEIAELYMNRVVDLCYELHTAPQDRTDDLTIPAFRAGSDADRNECGFAVTAVNGSDVDYSELLCKHHSMTNAMVQALLTASGDAWTQIENIWYIELRKAYQTLGRGADNNALKALRADQTTFENWLDARNALVELLYADQPGTVAQMSAKNVMNRLIEMCGGID